jgi:CubicO group peptidase (beta-lactamase class C family)
MAKFGQLFLQGGAWDGQQVISQEWVAQSTQPRLAAEGGAQYGYQWWFWVLDGYDVPFTAGGGGQYIFVVPELNMVAVTAANPQNVGDQEQRVVSLFMDHILPAALPAATLRPSGPTEPRTSHGRFRAGEVSCPHSPRSVATVLACTTRAGRSSN